MARSEKKIKSRGVPIVGTLFIAGLVIFFALRSGSRTDRFPVLDLRGPWTLEQTIEETRTNLKLGTLIMFGLQFESDGNLVRGSGKQYLTESDGDSERNNIPIQFEGTLQNGLLTGNIWGYRDKKVLVSALEMTFQDDEELMRGTFEGPNGLYRGVAVAWREN